MRYFKFREARFVKQNFSAIVLAGGQSSRMGQPKAELKFQGTTLLDRILGELRSAFDEIVVVAAPRGLDVSEKSVRLIRDEREYEGPLQALARGLDAIRNDAAFVCSCDLPLLKSGVAQALCAMLDHHDAVIPEIGGLAQPLHAVYRKRCVGVIGEMIARGEKRLTRISGSISARTVTESELRKIDADLHSFLNVNTPEDYGRAIAISRRLPPLVQGED